MSSLHSLLLASALAAIAAFAPSTTRAAELELVLAGRVFDDERVRQSFYEGVPWAELARSSMPAERLTVRAVRYRGEVVAADLGRHRFDPERARMLLAEAGSLERWRPVELIGPDESLRRFGTAVHGHLTELGIETEPITVSPAEIADTVADIVERGDAAFWLRRTGTLATGLRLVTDPAPLFPGSYREVVLEIDPASGIAVDDIELRVVGGGGGDVSLSRDDRFDALRPSVLLLAGHAPGAHRLQALHGDSGQLLAELPFEITTLWPNEQDGPSLWTSGDYRLPGAAGASWGGGSPTEPDNFNIIPVSGTRRVAVLLLDTGSQRFSTAESQNLPAHWAEILRDGFTRNGLTHSLAHYYREASYHRLDVDGQVFGPVQLSGTWSDYLMDDGNYKSNLWQACASAGDALIDFDKFQHLVCAVRSIDATATQPTRSVWAHADAFVAHVAEGEIPLATFSMPATGGQFDLMATAVHEFGHNLLLGDIYRWNGHPPQIRDRELGEWALMAHQSKLPHPTIAHRLRLGWLPEDDVKLYNFQQIAGFVDETLTLQAIELADPPPTQKSAVEVRIAPGWDYYFEYRAAQPGQIGDQDLPIDRVVLGTDVSFADDFEALQRRKPVMLLRDDADGDGAVLQVGEDYRERDTTEPHMATDFRASVSRTDGQSADLRIQYGVHSQPDPSVRPWNPPTYQSVDVEVRNARNATDNRWFNVPWAGHQNQLVAKVTNRGDMNAPGVRVDFHVKDMSVNAKSSQPRFIGSDKKDVDAGKTVEFETVWMPGKGGHYCIEVRIHHYQTPGPNSVVEATELNNFAQSNYDRFISATASWPSRETAMVTMENPFDVPVRARLKVVKSSSPLYRTFLEHRWLTLAPRERRRVRVMFEYAHAEPPVWDPGLEGYVGQPNEVAVGGFISLPGERAEAVMVHLGGINAEVLTGRATRTELLFDPPGSFSGWVGTLDDGEPVIDGSVILSVDRGREETSEVLPLDRAGRFSGRIEGPWRRVQAYYVPARGYADSESPPVVR